MRLPPLAILTLLAGVLAASPAPAAQPPLQQAREEAGEPPMTPRTWPLPAGLLTVTPSELLASGVARITFTVRLERPVPGGALAVELPRAFARVTASGIRPTRPPRAGRGDDIDRSGRTVVIPFETAEREYVFTLDNVGLPAGRYRLPLRWRAGRGARFEGAGAAELAVFAPAREGSPAPGAQWRGVAARSPVNASSDGFGSQSETYVALDPANPARTIVAANGAQEVEAFLDTGTGFEKRLLPAFADVAGTETDEIVGGTCDPVLAADPQGSLWYGGLTQCGVEAASPPPRIALARIDAANASTALAVALPVRPGSASQDKPMIAFDPVARRVYATWIEITGAPATNVVLTWCDVGLAGDACDTADAWQGPVAVTPEPGSYIYPDVATGPAGEVYVVWWDYSGANAIRGAVCAAACAAPPPAAPGFAAPATIAVLEATGGVPLPFACPILVAPGGRVGAVPSVEVDRSSGRVYVTWGDLRPGSGTTRCEFGAGGGTPPLATHLSWDSYVASRAGALPGGAQPSAAVGTRLVADGDEGVASDSEDFLPWVAVDQDKGEAWATLYSTGHDPARTSAHYVALSLMPAGDGHLVGPANRVSAAASGYAGGQCCQLSNDFGDYEGVAAAQGQVVPAWSDNSSGIEESYVFRGPLQTVGFDLDVTRTAELAGADGDGLAEPGERVALTVRARNTGTRTATGAAAAGVDGEVRIDGVGLAVAPARVAFPALSPGEEATASEPLQVAVDAGYDCGRPAALGLALSASEGAETVPVPLTVHCPAAPVAPPATPTPVPTPFVGGLVDFEVPSGQRLRTVRSRGLRSHLLCAAACRVDVRATIDSPTARRLKTRLRALGRGTVAVAGGRLQRVTLRLSIEARRALRRTRSRRVRITLRATVSGVSRGETASLTRRATLVP